MTAGEVTRLELKLATIDGKLDVISERLDNHIQHEKNESRLRADTCPHAHKFVSIEASMDSLHALSRDDRKRLDKLETAKNELQKEDIKQRVWFGQLGSFSKDIAKIAIAIIIALLLRNLGL